MIDLGAGLLWVLAGLALLAGIVLLWIDRAERTDHPGAVPATQPVPTRPAPVAAPPLPRAVRPAGPSAAGLPRAPAPPPGPPVVDRRALEERRRLVELCMDLSDRLADQNSALADRLHRGLAEVGVDVVEPDGAPFDRRAHDALDVEPAPSPALERTVASTARIGFVDRGEVLRRPGVVVYSSEDDRERR